MYIVQQGEDRGFGCVCWRNSLERGASGKERLNAQRRRQRYFAESQKYLRAPGIRSPVSALVMGLPVHVKSVRSRAIVMRYVGLSVSVSIACLKRRR